MAELCDHMAQFDSDYSGGATILISFYASCSLFVGELVIVGLGGVCVANLAAHVNVR